MNGIRACVKKNCIDPILQEHPDILCIQETKAKQDQVDAVFTDFPHHFWNAADRPGYSGTAVFSKIQPLSVKHGIDKKEHDTEGRVITIEFEHYFLVNLYVPNSGRGLPRLEYRKTWDAAFLAYLKLLEKKKQVIVCGDFNVAHTEIDLANPKENYNKTAGYTQVEIDGFATLLKSGFVDTFREFTKEGGHYTYWGAWNNLRARNIGWRIDYFIVSASFKNHIVQSFILPKIMGSDHCPIGVLVK